MKNKKESWVSVPGNSDFPLQNIPFGIIKPYQSDPRPATRIGNTVIDLSVLADFGYFDELEIPDLSSFYAPVLNDFIALGKKTTRLVRQRIMDLFSLGNSELQSDEDACTMALFKADEVQMLLPLSIGDYTDFYSSVEHATNVGMMFRDTANALLPNWRHLPVGYHGRSSSIVVSGTEIHRPKGQIKPEDSSFPIFNPSRRLDFELEMAFVTGKETNLGEKIPIDTAEDHIFGLLIFNDLSARDIQRWEYVPLGPFLSKSFGSVVSPWIVTLEALEPFRVDGPEQYPKALPYLQFTGKKNFDIQLDVYLKPEQGSENLLCHSNFKYMYWNMSQQLAHQTVSGCNVRVGDLYASGTISGPDPDSFGSMLELCWNGTRPMVLKDGTQRTFIQDGDTVIMRAFCEKQGLRIGFGECVTKIIPAL
ncbi:MAG: fumarylacetoacetase [Bacteroidales bacterium]|nr:fumarylacetoacetase [Bacteroidales bacterium]